MAYLRSAWVLGESMKKLLLGADGFIGTNLALKLLFQDESNSLVLYDKPKKEYINLGELRHSGRIEIKEGTFSVKEDFDLLTSDVCEVYHLISTTIPSNSNEQIAKGIEDNVVVTAKLLDACVRNKVSKVVFISSGGTVYGIEGKMPVSEDAALNPISAYGMQKISIEKLLYLYKYMYGLDYRIIRLANPFGPYQKPNGIQGVIATFLYQALAGMSLKVYGDGTVIRDYIYIDDAIDSILNIVSYSGKEKVFNLGTGVGYSLNAIIDIISEVTEKKLNVQYVQGRKIDVPINILDMQRYRALIGEIRFKSVEEGIRNTIPYIQEYIRKMK